MPKVLKDINITAMDHMSELNQQLTAVGYDGKERELLLVRLLLCFFADDTEVFPHGAFFRYLENCLENHSIGMNSLNRLFRVLAGTQEPADDLKEFPVISRQLFEENVEEKEMDAFFWLILMNCREITWREISPAIFGAMFQEIMNQQDRKEWGAYYTSEENIFRVIDPLFLEGLRYERNACRGNAKKLRAFHNKLIHLKFMDPACGCGNFLILIYRELRRLELSVIHELYDTTQRVLDTSMYCKISLDQFYGIELELFQAQIARIGLWLTQRQMDLEAAESFGIRGCLMPWISPVRIRQGNALLSDWASIVPPSELNYIVGNPPFLGARVMNAEQKADMKAVFRGTKGLGNLDYVTAWYRKAAEYMMGTHVRAAFVSTNSICQGEQAAVLWKQLKMDYNMQIDFAWKTFIWNNEVKNQAKVHCIIVGFSDSDSLRRGEQLGSRMICSSEGRKLVDNINAYLSAGPDVFVTARRSPIADVPEMQFGSMANDNGFLVLNPEERRQLLAQFPEARRMIRPYLGAAEFINGLERYCLWLKDEPEESYMKIPEIANRIAGVRSFRRRSGREATQILAETPELFGEIRQPERGNYILVPRVSSVRRKYIPMGFMTSQWIASDAVLIIPDADEAIFALLTSSMHMLWVGTIAGRLKSDLRYSASVVYNNYPFPELNGEQRSMLTQMGQEILEIRSRYNEEALADLYDPENMPEDLLSAHQRLDSYVDEIYGCSGKSEEEKLEELFTRYEALCGGQR